MNVGGELHKANGGRAHWVASLIGSTWCRYSGSGRRCAARGGSRRHGGNWRVEVFGAHAHDRTIALNLNLTKPSLLQSLNEHRYE
jgi:hypothetical protein